MMVNLLILKLIILCIIYIIMEQMKIFNKASINLEDNIKEIKIIIDYGVEFLNKLFEFLKLLNLYSQNKKY